MNCPCEILMDTDDRDLAGALLSSGMKEALRIENKFSRYKSGNIIHTINTSRGRAVLVDEETAHLLDFADQCHKISEGLFDVSSGILRKAWSFGKEASFPNKNDIDRLRPLVGWQKIKWDKPHLQMPEGMEIDLGGIAKEYAVDRALRLLQEKSEIGLLVNFGGDIAIGGRRRGDLP